MRQWILCGMVVGLTHDNVDMSIISPTFAPVQQYLILYFLPVFCRLSVSPAFLNHHESELWAQFVLIIIITRAYKIMATPFH